MLVRIGIIVLVLGVCSAMAAPCLEIAGVLSYASASKVFGIGMLTGIIGLGLMALNAAIDW